MENFITKPKFMRCQPPLAEVLPDLSSGYTPANRVRFTKEQDLAISHIDGLTVVNSGAGVGKTLCLVAKLAAIQQARQVVRTLCLAFSRKAALEIRDRVGPLDGVQVSTLHSLCFHLLRGNGYGNFTVITNQAITESVIRRLIGKADTTVDEVIGSLNNPNITKKATIRVRERYLEYLTENRMLTFDTMQLFAVRLLTANTALRKRWCSSWEYILIDEAQDLDYNQLAIINMLKGSTKNICLFGDNRQSIFSFRGSVPDVINSFDKSATRFELTINHRSNAGIIGLANKVMEDYPALKCSKSQKGYSCPAYMIADNEADEANGIIEQIGNLHQQGSQYKDIAVLYRSGFAAKKVIELLLEKGMPFASRISDVLTIQQYPYSSIINLFHAILLNNDTRTIKSILSVMYMKANAINHIEELARDNGCTLLDAMKLMELPFFHQDYVDGMVDAMKSVKDKSPSEVVHALLNAGLRKYLGTANTMVVESFADELQEYGSLEQYLQHISEIRGMLDEMKKRTADTDDVIQVMSIHAAKGLEWDNVFICGCYDGALPSNKDTADISEERRLLYTAITRAKEKLYISMPKVSTQSKEPNKICRFLLEALA